MKNKLYIFLILLSLSFMTLAKDTKQSKSVEVSVETDGDKVTKKIIVDGKELSPEEIKEFEAKNEMETLHSQHGNSHRKAYKFIVKDDEDVGENEDIEVSINADGDNINKKVIVNGKELSPEEIKEFEASGKMKVIHLDKDGHGKHRNKMIFIKSDDDSDHSDVDLEVIMDTLSGEDGGQHVWHGKDGKEIKIMKNIFNKSNDGASLGVVANVEDDGWHLSKIIEGSGAQKAQIKAGDIVTKIANVDLAHANKKEMDSLQQLPKFKDGESVKVELLREGKKMTLEVIASKLNDNSLFSDSDAGDNHFKWIEKREINTDDPSKQVKVMVFDDDDDHFKFNTDDIHVLFPDDLGDMNVFFSDGKSTSKLLGKNHEMSSLSQELGKYFNTKGGVLVLHVEDSNAFALKDGDVIKSIDGTEVNSPKAVVKQLLKADKQEDIKLKIVRHKRNKTLKYNK